ncbi:MAG: NUDIX domain-containing protein [Candidatus Woesearchaeota archaeon]
MTKTVCTLILYSKDKHVLLQHRDGGAPAFPNQWAFFGGSIEEGETLEDALAREILEELSYKVRNPKFMMTGQMSNIGADGEIYEGAEGPSHIFVEEYDETQELILHEGDGMGWFDFSEIAHLHMVPHDKHFLKLLEHKIKNL